MVCWQVLSRSCCVDPSQAAAARLAAKNAAANQISSKKQKKMDAYVKRKLKKEDRKGLIASLA